MNNYNNNSGRSQGGYRSENRGSGRPRFGSRDSGQNQMHDATCAECGDSCKVPFRPTSGKPVFCSNCFEKRDSGDSRPQRKPQFGNKKSFAPRENRPQENYKKQFDLLNAKLDTIINALATKEEKVVEVAETVAAVEAVETEE